MRFVSETQRPARCAEVDFTGCMAFEACCGVMAGQLALTCSDHPDVADCPDAVVVRSSGGEFQLPVRDGGTSYFPANFCPWCGTRLLPSEGAQDRAHWKADAALLGHIGARLFKQRLSVEVVIPLDFAKSATAAWDRDDLDAPGSETHEEAVERHRAATLALVGLAISERGAPTGESISVSLDPWLIGTAIDTAEEMGLITPEMGSDD